MIYITGDTHRRFDRLDKIENNNNNMIIILGDSGINYFLDDKDIELKEQLQKYKFKIFCIQGNHEERPENIKSYKEIEMFNGRVFIEENYPNLIFAKNGEIYNINNQSILVIGGAYSIDKRYRIMYGYKWFKNEQLTDKEKGMIINKCSGKHFDIVLSHTCPKKYEPTEVFIKDLNQSLIDKSMEEFLDEVEEKIDYNKWYCGHFHTDKEIDKIEFMYGNIKKLEKTRKENQFNF